MEKYIELLQKRNATAKVISPQNVLCAPWTILKCQFGCCNYNNNLCCPPFTPTYDKTRIILDSYSTAVLFESSDKANVTHIAVDIAKEMFFDGYYKAIAFGSGQCNICEKCNSQLCVNPGKAAPSMEACGIDVFSTARLNGFTINTLKSKEEKNHNFGLILVE